MSMTKERLEMEIILKTREIFRLYKHYNPNGNYLNISVIETEEGKARLHVNNAFYDRDHSKKIDISEDVKL